MHSLFHSTRQVHEFVEEISLALNKTNFNVHVSHKLHSSSANRKERSFFIIHKFIHLHYYTVCKQDVRKHVFFFFFFFLTNFNKAFGEINFIISANHWLCH